MTYILRTGAFIRMGAEKCCRVQAETSGAGMVGCRPSRTWSARSADVGIIWKGLQARGFHNDAFLALKRVVDRLCETICDLISDTVHNIAGRDWGVGCFELGDMKMFQILRAFTPAAAGQGRLQPSPGISQA